jgi:hypothetical protein
MVCAMGFIVIECEQRSPEWRAARAGRLTGSRASVVLMKGRSGEPSKTREKYLLQLIGERINGEARETFFANADMQRGIGLEPLAFAMYEADMGAMVRRTGFLQSKDHMAGCSLDGDIGNFSGILELKCPMTAQHLAYRAHPENLLNDYRAQVRHNLWISGATFCDLISFDDRLPKKLQLLRVRVERGDCEIAAYAESAIQFLADVDLAYQRIMESAA